MSTLDIIIVVAFALLAIGFVIWIALKDRKPNPKPVEPDVPEPQPEPDVPDTPGTPDEPVEPDTPDEPVDPEPIPEPEPTPEPEPKYDSHFEGYLNMFADYISLARDSNTYQYLYDLYKEAEEQFFDGKSVNGLPALHKKENFPSLYEFGKEGNSMQAFDTLMGWLIALQLSELKPYYRTDMLRIGYEMGSYNKYDNIYGYDFDLDPNLVRILAGAIYAAMRGLKQPNVETMRYEVSGSKYDKTLEELSDSTRDNVSPKDFFTDFREFMPTAPGPYAPGYTTRPDNTYPTEGRDKYSNLQVDRDIHEYIVEAYNLNVMEHYQETVQAIADKEADKEHLFGKNRKTEHFQFHPVFGEDTIGIELQDNGDLANLVSIAITASSASRGILQSATVSPKQYGRLRPGCSWKQEAKKNSDTDDRRNVLTNFEIEDGDGSPTGYYDSNGNWVYKDAISSPADFEEDQKNSLWANSYPSGHSAGIMGGAMVLIELMPDKADVILKAANQYAVNRTIARYHWTSDTINGRVLGSATNAVAHAASDYDYLLSKARRELQDNI